MLDISFETYVAPAAAPHPYLEFVKTLDAKGPDEIATVKFTGENAEADGKAFIKDMQNAANQIGKSATKRLWIAETDAKGKYTGTLKVGVSVRPKITRSRPTAAAVTTAPAEAAADAAAAPTPGPRK